MLTTAGRRYVILTLLAWMSLAPLREVRAQAVSQTNRYDRGRSNVAAPPAKPAVTRDQPETPAFPFQMPSLTLTGTVAGASATARPQTMGELTARIKAALYTGEDIAALEYATTDLIGSPEGEAQLLKAQAVALAKLHRLPDAIATLKHASIIQPNDTDIVNNIGELLLITGQTDEYRTFEFRHKDQFDKAYDGVLAVYFSVLEAYQTEDEDQFRETATRLVASLPSKKGPLLGDWAFDQVLSETARQPRLRKKAVLMTFLRVLMGDLDRNQAVEMIQGL